MTWRLARVARSAFFWGALVWSAAAAASQAQRETLWIDRRAAPALALSVEVAQTPRSRMTGLMGRTELAEGTGMVFDFGHDRPVSMWMKNTLIPLDMLFISGEGVIVRIVENAPPRTLAPRRSGQAVRAVLEIGAGRSRALGIAVGDRVRHRIFKR